METNQIFKNSSPDKEAMAYIHNGIILGHKKRAMQFTAIWKDLENILLS